MRSTSFDKSSVIQLESFLGLKTNLLSGRMKDGEQPSNEEIRNLIISAEKKYNSDWRNKREINRIENEGRVSVGTGSPLPDNMEQFKDGNGQILDHSLPGALDMVAQTLQRRSTSSFKEFDENGFDKAFRKSPRAITSLISNGLNYLVKYPILAGVGGGIASGLILAESGIRTGLTCLYCIGYGILEITEKFESTSLARKAFGNNEFEIRGAKESVGSDITNLFNNHYTLGFINRKFFSNGSQKSDQNKEKSEDPKIAESTSERRFDYTKPGKNILETRLDYSAQAKIKSTNSPPSNTYPEVRNSDNKREIKKVASLRLEKHKQEEKRKEAERKEREETKKPQQTRRTSTFPSQSPGQIHNPLIDPKTGKLGRAPLSQTSPLSRPKPHQPPRERGGDNRRPGPDPRQPLSATPTKSRATVNSTTGPRPR